MHKPFFTIALLTIIFISGCNSIDKKELKIIDDIQLGTSVAEYDSLLTKLNIERQDFLTTIFFMNYNFSSNTLNFPYTKNFDFSNFRSSRNKHLGLLYPTTLAGTDNIISLSVILVHTETPLFVLPKEVEPQIVSDDYTCVSQHVSGDVIDAIENMYNSKYGKAKDTITEPMFIRFFKIQGDGIKAYNPPDIKDFFQEIVWETKYLKIRLFKGIPSSEEKFDKKENRYRYKIGTNDQGIPEVRDIKVDYQNGETMCRAYSFIQYEIKQEIIDKLKLDKKKI